MCVIETRIYISEDGNEQRLERKQPCQYALSGGMCEEIKRKEVRARIVETRPQDVSFASRASGDFIVTQDQHGRGQAYRRLSRKEGKQPARHRTEAFGTKSQSTSPASPRRVSATEVRPAALSPPSPAGNQHHYHRRSSYCPRPDCPMMTSARDIEGRSPMSSLFHENDFIRDLPDVGPSESRRRSVTIRMPTDSPKNVPILSTPTPRRNRPSDHKRQDSALGLPDNGNSDQAERAAADARWRAQRAQEQRDLTLQQERLARDEDRRRRAEAQEQARQAQLIHERARARDDERRHNSSLHRERQRQAQDAAEAAYRKARKAEHDAQADAEYERRVQSETRERERERREAEYRRSREVDVLVIPHRSPLLSGLSPISPRRSNRTALIHQDIPALLTPRPRSMEQPSPVNDVIRREQDRMEREASTRPAGDDPLVEDQWRGDDNVVREWANSEDDARRARMRRHRDLERGRIE